MKKITLALAAFVGFAVAGNSMAQTPSPFRAPNYNAPFAVPAPTIEAMIVARKPAA